MDPRTRIRAEIALSAVLLIGFVGTLLVPDWIEAVFGADPDKGSGQLEWAIVIVVGLIGLFFAWLARFEWVRLRRATANGQERASSRA